MSKRIAVVGATGAVGRMMLQVLHERSFAASEVIALASARSAGQQLPYGAQMLSVQDAATFDFRGVDIALFSAGAALSRTLAPQVAAAGAVVIDNSSAWRMHPEVPLVVPEVNAAAAQNRPLGIIANPNCSTIQLVVALAPLHRVAKIQHIVVCTYQAASGKGQAALKELRAQSQQALAGQAPAAQVFPAQLAFNLLSDWPAGEADHSEEEWKLVRETRKILNDPAIGVSPTCVRVPVECGHSEAVQVEFARPMHAAEAKQILAQAPGVRLLAAPYAPGNAPQPLQAAGCDDVWVGRVRDDLAKPGVLNLWVVADNLRKGAASNAVQVAELL